MFDLRMFWHQRIPFYASYISDCSEIHITKLCTMVGMTMAIGVDLDLSLCTGINYESWIWIRDTSVK